MIETPYGKKQPGASGFVIVAPHAAGDDLKTGYIARKLAEKLNGFAVINTVYKKPSNSDTKSENREDFNKLTWWEAGQKYLWIRPKQHHPAMRQFFKDIQEYVEQARTFREDNKAVCIHIHGMKSITSGIDLGAGIPHKDYTFEKNTGTSTLDTKILYELQSELQNAIFENSQLPVTIGMYSGGSRQSAIQFHAHGQNQDHAVQIEISSFFRQEKEKRDFIIQTLSNTLSKIF